MDRGITKGSDRTGFCLVWKNGRIGRERVKRELTTRTRERRRAWRVESNIGCLEFARFSFRALRDPLKGSTSYLFTRRAKSSNRSANLSPLYYLSFSFCSRSFLATFLLLLFFPCLLPRNLILGYGSSKRRRGLCLVSGNVSAGKTSGISFKK